MALLTEEGGRKAPAAYAAFADAAWKAAELRRTHGRNSAEYLAQREAVGRLRAEYGALVIKEAA